MKQHAALASRVAANLYLEPLSERKIFLEFLEHGLKAAGADSELFADNTAELLFRASRGVPRRVSRLVREVLMLAHDQNKNFVDETTLESILDEEGIH